MLNYEDEDIRYERWLETSREKKYKEWELKRYVR